MFVVFRIESLVCEQKGRTVANMEIMYILEAARLCEGTPEPAENIPR